jgi:hypothetical protein
MRKGYYAIALLAWVLWAEVSNSNTLEIVRQIPIEAYETKAECEAVVRSITRAVKNMRGFTVLGDGAWSINTSDGLPAAIATLTCFSDTINLQASGKTLPHARTSNPIDI